MISSKIELTLKAHLFEFIETGSERLSKQSNRETKLGDCLDQSRSLLRFAVKVTHSEPSALTAVETENERLENRGMATLSLRIKCEFKWRLFATSKLFLRAVQALTKVIL